MSRRFSLAFALLLSLFASLAFAADATLAGLKRLALAPPNAYGSFDGVATFNGAMPTSAQLDQIRGLGLKVQGFENLPLAMLRGPKQALFDAVTRGYAADVWPNEKLKYFSVASDFSIKANEVHALGINGAGVTVAVVDSGIDGTHPDLVQRVARNYKMIDVGTVAAGVAAPPIIQRMDTGPYNNSDTSSGHGTHVAGIIAADNTDGKVLGVAPGAKLVGYGTGEAVFVFNVLTAFDDIISAGDVRVVNNSWGSSFRLFNPDEPINQATLAMYGAGIVVVFAAGNASTEMALNPYSAAPWVISVGNGTLAHQRNTTSSGGIEFDNSFLTLLPATDEKALVFAGDRIGLYHPSLSAPGTNIVSTATTGVLVTAPPGGTASASGTSMAAPHIAGVAALMLQKNPNLSPAEVKSAMQVTSDPMPSLANTAKVEAFHMQGYGFVNAKAAVDLVGRKRYSKDKALAKLQSALDAKILADRDYKVASTNYWSFTAAAATVNGSDARTYTVPVASTTKAIKALVSYPSLGFVSVARVRRRESVRLPDHHRGRRRQDRGRQRARGRRGHVAAVRGPHQGHVHVRQLDGERRRQPRRAGPGRPHGNPRERRGAPAHAAGARPADAAQIHGGRHVELVLAARRGRDAHVGRRLQPAGERARGRLEHDAQLPRRLPERAHGLCGELRRRHGGELHLGEARRAAHGGRFGVRQVLHG
jgi:serine protease AprX